MGLFSNGFEKILTHIVEIYGAKFNCSKTEGSFFRQNITFYDVQLVHMGQSIVIPKISIYKEKDVVVLDLESHAGTCQFRIAEYDVTATGITIDIINEICPNDYDLDNIVFSYDYLRSKLSSRPCMYISLLEEKECVKSLLNKFMPLLMEAEDPWFFEHHGVSPIALNLASLTNLHTKRSTRGGSSLTMQLMKNAFTSPIKSLQRKLIDIMLALKFEETCSKVQLLELYINYIELAPNVYGLEAGAQHYFNKHIWDLTGVEASCIIYFIPRAKYVPEALLMKSDRICENMKLMIRREKNAHNDLYRFPLRALYIDFAEPYGRIFI